MNILVIKPVEDSTNPEAQAIVRTIRALSETAKAQHAQALVTEDLFEQGRLFGTLSSTIWEINTLEKRLKNILGVR